MERSLAKRLPNSTIHWIMRGEEATQEILGHKMDQNGRWDASNGVFLLKSNPKSLLYYAMVNDNGRITLQLDTPVSRYQPSELPKIILDLALVQCCDVIMVFTAQMQSIMSRAIAGLSDANQKKIKIEVHSTV
jgi:hypothetical protein